MITVTTKAPKQYGGDMVVYFVRQEEKGAPVRPDDSCVGKTIERAFASGDFTGKEGQTLLCYPESAKGRKRAKRALVIGLGKDLPTREILRKAGGTAASAALKVKVGEMLAVVPNVEQISVGEAAECLTEGLVLGAYRFKKYKTNTDSDENSSGDLKKIVLYAENSKAARAGMRKGRVAAMAGCTGRDMANEPGNFWTPARFAEYAEKLADGSKLKCKILSRAEMKRLGMGGILGVNQGSAVPPKMIILEYTAGKKAPTVLLVGKGLTFDSGGISLKPGKGMEAMKYDMCGGAAVLAAMQAVAEERPKGLNVVAVVPATENLPGPAALKPGDIITQCGGKTVEVINTDAEGRLILADAISYGIKKYKPDVVIDIATLTGAVIIGLGHHRIGLLANDDNLAKKLMDAGDRSGEPLWRLPLGSEYSKQLKSEVADIKNIGGRDAGTITAAAFLQEFVGDTTWAHLDIAGTAWGFTEKSYIPKGPSGIGARTFIELIRAWK